MNQRVQGPGMLLDDPLGRGASIELTFVEVPYWWVEADLRICMADGAGNDCALLVVDVCNPDSFKAAVTRGKWAMAAGLECQLVLSFAGPCGQGGSQERLVPPESLEWLADEVSVVKPAHFDCTQASGAANMMFQVELFLKVLTLRLLWLNLTSLGSLGKISGLYTPSTSTPSRMWTGPTLSSRADPAPNVRQRTSRSPGPPRCANILPARYQPGASPVERTPRGRICWGSETRSVSPRSHPPNSVHSLSRPRRDRSPPRGPSPQRVQTPQPCVLRELRVPEAAPSRDTSPARLAAAEAKRLVAEGQGRTPAVGWERAAKAQDLDLAPLETVVKLTVPQERSRRSSNRGAFKVDLDLGGGVVAAIAVQEETDLEAAAADVA